jgi:predicted PurR-regulated permease PerM
MAAKRFFVGLLLISAALVAWIVYHLAAGLLVATMLASLLWPLHVRFAKKLGKRANLSAALWVVAVALLGVGPVIGLSAYAVKQATSGIQFVSETLRSEGVTGLMDRLPKPLARASHSVVDALPHHEDTVKEQVTAQGGAAAAAITGAISSFFFQVAMMLIALFFFLRHGEDLLAWLDEASPLKRGQTRSLLKEMKDVMKAMFVSNVATGAVQAAAALIGYLIARLPQAMFFAVLTFVLSFVPVLGAGAVCLGAAGLLALTGHWAMAIFLAVWGIVVVGLIDNVTRPLFVRMGVEEKMSGAVIFFAIVGGIAAFGGIGLLLGPMVAALFLALLRMYNRDFSPKGAGAAS